MDQIPIFTQVKQGSSAIIAGGLAEWDNNGDLFANNFRAATALRSAGGLFTGIQKVTTNYTALATDSTILVDATAGAVTITLPAAAACQGQEITVKKVDASANAVTVAAAATIDGAATKSLPSQYNHGTYQSDGVTWWILT